MAPAEWSVVARLHVKLFKRLGWVKTLYRSNKNATSIMDSVSKVSTDAAKAALSNALPPPFAEYL